MTNFHGKNFIFFATKIVNLEQQTNIQPNFSFISATFSQFVTKNNSNQNFSVPFMSLSILHKLMLVHFLFP